MTVETGTGATPTSTVETFYAPCACSPTGEVWKVSLPYAPGGAVHWIEYVYDKLGRTIQVKNPNNSGSTLCEYVGNTVTVTEPAGKWMTMTMDGFGNLVTVVGPNPVGGTFTTRCAYNSFNRLRSSVENA